MIRAAIAFVVFVALWYLIFMTSNARPLATYTEPHDRLRCARCVRKRRQALRDTVTRPSVRDGEASPTDCSTERRFCANDADCTLLCRGYKRLFFRCDTSSCTCEPFAAEQSTPGDEDDGKKSDPDDTKDACDVSRGEYAMLTGYTSLGTAIWQCVQLYQQFMDQRTFCENGVFDMDARVREPSYRDCRCSNDDIRVAYRQPGAYERGGDLPHCVPAKQWHLYRLSMRRV